MRSLCRLVAFLWHPQLEIQLAEFEMSVEILGVEPRRVFQMIERGVDTGIDSVGDSQPDVPVGKVGSKA